MPFQWLTIALWQLLIMLFLQVIFVFFCIKSSQLKVDFVFCIILTVIFHILTQILAEHHSVPIVPLTHATVGTAYPHAFSYGLKSAPCVNVNNVPVPCATGGLLGYGLSSLSPALWSSPNLNTLVYTTSPGVSPPDNEVAGVLDNEVAEVVDLRTAGSDRKKRDAGYLGYHGGYLGGEATININTLFITFTPS